MNHLWLSWTAPFLTGVLYTRLWRLYENNAHYPHWQATMTPRNTGQPTLFRLGSGAAPTRSAANLCSSLSYPTSEATLGNGCYLLCDKSQLATDDAGRHRPNHYLSTWMTARNGPFLIEYSISYGLCSTEEFLPQGSTSRGSGYAISTVQSVNRNKTSSTDACLTTCDAQMRGNSSHGLPTNSACEYIKKYGHQLLQHYRKPLRYSILAQTTITSMFLFLMCQWCNSKYSQAQKHQ